MTERRTKRQRLNKGLRTVAGGAILLVGIVAIPYPGPGWLIVFAGLAVLARDYDRAQRVLDGVKSRYETWQEWVLKQSPVVRAGIWLGTAVVVIVSIYLLNGYGIINSILNLNSDWLNSPLVK